MKYRTIVADPPWPYPEGHIRNTATGRSQNRRRDGAKAVLGKAVRRQLPYSSMNVGQIAALPVADLVESDARLFLWATNRYLPHALTILETWGFRYRQTLIWHKAEATPYPGSIAGNTVEFMVVGVLGSPPRTGTWPTALIRQGVSKRWGHSAKPDVFLDLVEQVSPGPYLELFARRQRLGWDTWGDEALNHIDLSVTA